ncbi:AAA family ATPase [Pseudomonas chlororaphis]|uniref:AAA family ATPase n=1 Tax=Pseudomonas chlororaphis TaxID=587753 RepID=UPI00209A8295|nr:AAA family ATPase [Pseudomonas chlororaphis]MCO7613291.1 AAA family ATPase [Pseudomonas chlororaphis]
MIIKSFSARKVHDFYDYNLKFKPDINFLVGNNGAGKTTALRLMQAALSIDVALLLNMKFSSLKIEVEKDGEDYSLAINASPEKMLFRLNGWEFFYKVSPAFSSNEGRLRSFIAGGRTRRHIEDVRQEIIRAGGPLLHGFLRGTRPMFLGLERRLGNYQDDLFSDEVFTDEDGIQTRSRRKEILDGLDSCQQLVQAAYKQYRRASDGRLDRLLNIIVESTFEYVEIEPKFLDDARPYLEMSDLRQRREELEKFARDLGGSEKNNCTD